MKKRNTALFATAFCLASAFLLSGCNGQKQIDSNKIEHIEITKEVHLQDDVQSPGCKLAIDYAYPAENSAADSVAQRINQAVQTAALGKEYADMPVTAAVDSFVNAYLANYRKEVGELYAEDLKNNDKETRPDASWYNYEYNLTTTFGEGKEGVITCQIGKFEYSGGAHPNSWEQWLNFGSTDGKQIALNDVFMEGSNAPIKELLLKELIKEMSGRLSDEKIETLEDLQKAGVLLDTDIYVPENFLLEKEKVSFLYNKYDIAPYSMGEIILSLPYSTVEKYMTK